MNYCNQCGSRLETRVPAGDNLPRYVCTECGGVHYQNPKIVAGCITHWHDKLLLCRRAIEPRYGLWTVPAGFMENRETVPQAAARETLEEANARVDGISLFGLYNLPHISQVYILFRGELREGTAYAGAESLEVGLFAQHEIPWDELAFPVIRESLERYFSDREQGGFVVHTGDILRDETGVRIVRHD